jgi:hypothetical protein
MKTLRPGSALAVFILACASLMAQAPLPQFTVGAGIGMDSNAPVANPMSTAPAWTQQLNGWTSFGVKVDTRTYSYNTIHVTGNVYTLMPGIMLINYQSGNLTLGTIIDGGIVSSSNATGGGAQLGEGLFYHLKGVSTKLTNWYATAVCKASYTSVSPVPAAGYAVKPVFEFGLTYGAR